jgi:hypothetical protein
MSPNVTGPLTTYYILLARSFIVFLGCTAIWWGILEFPLFWQDASIKGITERIIAGDPFKSEALAQQLPIIDRIKSATYCRPAALRSAAIIQLRMMETAAPSERTNGHRTSLINVIRSSLFCTPADPYLWLALYSRENSENGSTTDGLKYLRMSYNLGPNEGWIAVRRNRIAFARFQQLPPDLKEKTIDEFAGMLKSSFFDQATDIFVGPAWPEREPILLRLASIPYGNRQVFADMLYSRGYDINVPGVKRPESRALH